jgi:pyridoxine 4-dehydrogenase
MVGPPLRSLARTLSVATNVPLLIPGTSSVRHLEENLAAASIELDEDIRQQLNVVA